MNLSNLRASLAARGFNHLPPTLQAEYLNWTYRVDICGAENWPFLLTSTTGTAPLTITDLGSVKSVIDTSQQRKLRPLDDTHITDDWDTDLTTTGSPEFYYFTSQTVLQTYPTSSDSLSVAYWKVPDELTDESDEPVIPERFHPLIVDGAVRRAYERANEFEGAAAAQQLFEYRFEQMRRELLEQQSDAPQRFIVTTWED